MHERRKKANEMFQTSSYGRLTFSAFFFLIKRTKILFTFKCELYYIIATVSSGKISVLIFLLFFLFLETKSRKSLTANF